MLTLFGALKSSKRGHFRDFPDLTTAEWLDFFGPFGIGIIGFLLG